MCGVVLSLCRMLADSSQTAVCIYKFYPLVEDASTCIIQKIWNYKLSTILYKLWVCPFPVSLHPSLVNVHIHHPPEAEVHIHQVARVQPGQRPATTEGAHSVQQRSQPGNGHETTNDHNSRHPHASGNGHGQARPHSRQNGHVGRCFQETVDGQVLC